MRACTSLVLPRCFSRLVLYVKRSCIALAFTGRYVAITRCFSTEQCVPVSDALQFGCRGEARNFPRMLHKEVEREDIFLNGAKVCLIIFCWKIVTWIERSDVVGGMN